MDGEQTLVHSSIISMEVRIGIFMCRVLLCNISIYHDFLFTLF